MVPSDAARYLGVPTWKLRYWADHGVITCVNNDPGHHRRYLAQELETVRYLTGKYPRVTPQCPPRATLFSSGPVISTPCRGSSTAHL